jgi:hypothetical protein
MGPLATWLAPRKTAEVRHATLNERGYAVVRYFRSFRRCLSIGSLGFDGSSGSLVKPPGVE